MAEATRLLKAAGLYRIPVDLDRLAKMLGVLAIRTVPMDSAKACLVPSKVGPTILLNERTSPRMRRFSLAHEIAHIIVHGGGRRFRARRGGARDDDEKLCDRIAAELLMPRELFELEAFSERPSIDTIVLAADTFDASLNATVIRFAELAPFNVAYSIWERNGDWLRAKWVRGPLQAPIQQERRLWDMTSGQVLAYHDDECVTSYEAAVNENSLSLRCQSGGFGIDPNRFVLCVTHEDQL